MPRLSAFTTMGQWRMSSAPSYVENWYRLLPRMWGTQLDFSNVGSYNEEKLYAVARICALMQAEIEHAGNQRNPPKCFDLLPLQELDFLLTPGPKDDYVARQNALSAATLNTKGGIASNIVAQLSRALASNFLAYLPNPAGTPTVFPTSPGSGPGAFKDTRIPAKFLQLVDPIVVTGGGQWFAYQALDTSSVPTTVWSAGATFSVGQQVVPTPLGSNGFYFTCSAAGQTGASEPTWPSQVGGTVVDGGATWTCSAQIADALVKGDVAVFDAGNTHQMEKVTISAVANTPPANSLTTRGYLYARGNFTQEHDIGAPVTTGTFPYWWSTQRLSYAILSAASAVDPASRNKASTLINKLNRGVDQLAIVQPTTITSTGGTIGPLQVGSPMGATPIGSFAFANSLPTVTGANPWSGFAPTDLPGVQFWARSDLRVVTSGGLVTNWTDNASGLTGTPPASPPAYVSNGINGRPLIRMNSVAGAKLDFPTIAALNLGQGSFDVFVIGQARSVGAFVVLVGKGSPSSADNLRWFLRAGNQPDSFWGNDSQAYVSGSIPAVTANTPCMVEWGLDAPNHTVRYAAGAISATFSGQTPAGIGSNSLPIEIGGNPTNSTYDAPWDFAEVVIANHYMLPGERALLVAYFQSLYGNGIAG